VLEASLEPGWLYKECEMASLEMKIITAIWDCRSAGELRRILAFIERDKEEAKHTEKAG